MWRQKHVILIDVFVNVSLNVFLVSLNGFPVYLKDRSPS